MRIGEATNKEDLLAALKTAKDRRGTLRRPFEQVWWNNIALIGGDHSAQWDPMRAQFSDRDTITSQALRDKKAKLVLNHALKIFRIELAKMTKSQPVMDVVANSDEETDLAATKVGRAGLEYAEWKFKLARKRKQALTWALQTGIGAIYCGWDYLQSEPGVYEFVIDPNTGDATFNPDREKELRDASDAGGADLVVERYPMGDVEYKVFSPFQLYPDETVNDITQAQDLITTEICDLDVIRGIYGRSAKDLNPDSSLVLGAIEQRMLRQAGLNPTDQQVMEAVAMNTFWLLPDVYRGNKFLQDGIYVRWVNDTILDISKAFPYRDGRMPFAFFQHIPRETVIWPDCITTHIRDLNLEIDKTVSQIIDNKDYMANPMWRVATQHRIKGKIKNVAGGILRYVHSGTIPPPEPVVGMEMPQQVEDLVNILAQQMGDISGQSDVASGRVPSGARSGVAVSYLQEEDDTKIGPTIQDMEDSIAYLGSLTLERFAQYYAAPRILRFYRRDGEFDVLKFQGSDLANNTDVVCQAGSALPRNKAAKQQFTLDLVDKGVLTDPKQIMDMLELGEADPDLADLQVAMANRENKYMTVGMPAPMFDTEETDARKMKPVAVPVKKWHNHALHLKRHYATMSTPEFDKLQTAKPEIVRLFDEHTAQHEQFLAQQAQQQLQTIQATRGAPGGVPAGQQAADGTPAGGSQAELQIPQSPAMGNGAAQPTGQTGR